ncbi:MAG: site-specific DNA-methyltransferase [Nanoarchaeota archaeon]|nr:site-specific DNA-methyltransferase [Nanoarchaeota archaeon]
MKKIDLFKNKVICGDCIELMREMPGKSVDVIITSPPYNIGVKYNSHKDNMPFEEYLDWMERFGKECFRILKEDGSFFFNIGDKPSDELRSLKVAERINKSFKIQNTINWVKSIAVPEENVNIGHYKPVNSKRYLNNGHEFIFHFTKKGNVEIDKLSIGVPYQDKSNIGRWGHAKKDLRDRGDMWFIPYETVNGNKPHPAMFPVKLPEMCIKLHGLKKGRKLVVLDPFLGAGSTALASKRLGCDYIGVEIDKKYCKLSQNLLSETSLKNWTKNG